MTEAAHCYAHQGCNGPGLCACDCPACVALTPRYRPRWCAAHPGKRHVHAGTTRDTVTTWRCVDA